MREYKCKKCKGVVGLNEQKIKANKDLGRYICCPYCGCKYLEDVRYIGMDECRKGGGLETWRIT